MKEEVEYLLQQRGVDLEEIAELVYFLQKPYLPDLTCEECLESLIHVIEKRDVQYTVLTGIILDILAEQDLLPEPLLSLIKTDHALYGVDEALGLGITNSYGSIGLTNFGYLGRTRLGIIGELNIDGENQVNTFLDDLVAGLAAAASARLAHQHGQPCKTPFVFS